MSETEDVDEKVQRRKLILEARSMVEGIAGSLLKAGIPAGFRGDLIAWGNLGATEAGSRYQFQSKTPFLGFAHGRILGSMINGLKKDTGHLSEAQAKALRGMVAALSAAAEYAELIQDTGADDLDEDMRGATAAGVVALLCGGQPAHRPEGAVFVVQALSFLPEQDRAIVRWHVFDGRTFKDIAEHLGAADESTVRKRYKKSIKKLAVVLADLAAGH